MKTSKIIRNVFALLLCVCFVLTPLSSAAADDAQEPPMPDDSFQVLDGEELTAIVEQLFDENNLNKDHISVGFYYSATGEEWYYHEDASYYSASLYKVPLMMLVAQKVKSGEINYDLVIRKRTLSELKEWILQHSNNTYAHQVMDHFWPNNEECRRLWPALAEMSNEDFDDRLYKASEFTAPLITRMMRTLYLHGEDYPGVTDDLLLAQPDMYLRSVLKDSVPIAQKYGAYDHWANISGIIYTDTPIIVTYMATYVGEMDRISGELAARLTDYAANVLDARVTEHRAEQERLAAEEKAKAEEEARAAEEEQKKQEEEERQLEEQRQEEAEQQEQQRLKKQNTSRAVRAAGIVVVTSAILGLLLKIGVKRRPKKKQPRKGKH